MLDVALVLVFVHRGGEWCIVTFDFFLNRCWRFQNGVYHWSLRVDRCQ